MRGRRYDYLMEQVGAKAAPAVGWALGVERVLELLKEQGKVLAALLVMCTPSFQMRLHCLQRSRLLRQCVQRHKRADARFCCVRCWHG